MGENLVKSGVLFLVGKKKKGEKQNFFIPKTSIALNLALNQASSPNCPLKVLPRAKSLGKPHTADIKDDASHLLALAALLLASALAE